MLFKTNHPLWNFWLAVQIDSIVNPFVQFEMTWLNGPKWPIKQESHGYVRSRTEWTATPLTVRRFSLNLGVKCQENFRWPEIGILIGVAVNSIQSRIFIQHHRCRLLLLTSKSWTWTKSPKVAFLMISRRCQSSNW